MDSNPKFKWQLVVIGTSGTEIPHFTGYTRRRVRQEMASLKAQCGGKLPRGVRAIIRKEP